MDPSSFFDAVREVLKLLLGSSSTAILSAVGLVLLLLAGVMAYVAVKSKPEDLSTFNKVALFVCLIGGILFSAAGPALALFYVSQNPIQTRHVDQRFEDLINNARVNFVVRLIAYDPIENPERGIDRLTKLGPQKQVYSFVADYNELVGRSVRDALEMLGSPYENGQHVSAVIFPLETRLYPANARGLLQVIREVEAQSTIELKDRFFADSGMLKPDEIDDLREIGIHSYRVESFKSHYPRYCQMARTFFCGQFASRDQVGGLYRDWHPLGFSQKNPPTTPCSIPVHDFCTFTDWNQGRANLKPKFGSRAFLLKNLEINRIPGRILISFEKEVDRVIPDIGAR
ncbi:MAG: hypothetical protein Q8L13_09500 [Bradyrhizobium sp.]|uniref:hypothetical protein n=1 Tax=Bradyrhizobium sp. TaxID=376 RepID=UPI00272F4DA8|nr:hypothetical protein [Bradyrhizobium sp.]MDP1866560.1 hypothetical protein [Bradyrhizobium sp.]